ncbi:DUF1840 domain-containing protein [Photobacterium lucens]|uniref:DUF1840 domain-containing protein n=1 Tax=Photobacterium lucens TaxID=2562949 RepID=UPI001368C3E7|nr:DUF1840 domain-containing protein [Photobacterium lucens]MBP2700709.1 DUF1840 domain-containing protein [Vibrio parahaemolyticus]MZG58133.1 DUF1840 domain-containing protein [Photobacterium lucens]MZG82734.1 DUF1840 domain-containing protein [Photobacterium lucens]
MLITFRSKGSHDVTMFGDIAQQLIHMMGFCETVPGAIREEDIAQALRNLNHQIDMMKQQNKQGDIEQPNPLDADLDEGEFEPEICLSVRALPIIGLLESAIQNHSYVMWE